MGEISDNMNYKYNFSVIIPHKNIPELLRRCVSSIPRRDDTEIVIVDDNSDPDKVDFEHFPFMGEPNVKVIFDKAGLRQGHARNVGLQHAEGKWILFADSDDFFFYSINKAMDDCLQSDADIIYYKSTNLDSETYQYGSVRSTITNTSISRYLNGDSDGEHFIRYRHPVPWGKFIRASVIRDNNICFPEIIKAEDFEFSYKCGYYAKKVEAHAVSIYCLTSREGNVTARKETAEVKNIVVKNEADFLKFAKEHELAGTPAFNIIEPDVFSILLDLQQMDNAYYEDARKHILDCGYTNSEIDSKLRHIANGRKKAVIVSNIRKLLHI